MKDQELSLTNLLNTSSSRREFIFDNIKKIGLIAVGTYTVSLINACNNSNPVSPSGNSNATVTVDINQAGNTALKSVGGTIAIGGNELDNTGMLLIRKSDTEILAFSRFCTHQGCTVNKFSNGIAYCPCHGSEFNTDGKVVRGPASSPLKKYNAVLSGNIITITS